MKPRFSIPGLILVFTLDLNTIAHSAPEPVLPSLPDILNSTRLDVRSTANVEHITRAPLIDLRRDTPLRQQFHTGAGVNRIVRIALLQAYWNDSWTPDETLVLNLYDEGDHHRLMRRASEPYSRRQWEGAVHLLELDVPAVPDHAYSFELTVEGGDGLIRGFALTNGPLSAGVSPLLQGGKALDGQALWFETHVKTETAPDALYAEVFSHFDLDRPGMAAVKEAVAKRDWNSAREELIKHFESRTDLFGTLDERQAETLKSNPATLAEANLAVQGKLIAADGELVDLGPRWNYLAEWKTRGGVGLTRSGLRKPLAAAYRMTHDEKYARAWNAMLRYNFYDLPSPLRSGVIPAGAHDIPPTFENGIGGGSMWAALSIGARLNHAFIYYRAFVDSPSFDQDTRFAFIADLAEMGDVLPLMKGGGNWEAQRTTGLFDFALQFPEFKQAHDWLASGFNGAVQNCLENTFPDGPLHEATVNYHNLSLNRYLDILEKASSVGFRAPREMRHRVARMLDYEMYTTMPNGYMPLWGDSNPATGGQDLLRKGARLMGRPDWLWVASGGRAGHEPTVLSRAFPEAGYFIMRSGWRPESSFLAVHNGHSSAHGHADENSFMLTALGRELLIDPGIYIYGTPESAQLERSVSHNTVTMDDQDTRNEQGPASFSETADLAYYDGTNSGYKGKDPSARHRRRIVFFKTGPVLVVDDLNANDSHVWTVRFHCAPGKLVAGKQPNECAFLPDPGGGPGEWAKMVAGPPQATKPPILEFHGLPGIKLEEGSSLAAASWEQLTRTPVVNCTSANAKTAHFATLLTPRLAEKSPAAAGWVLERELDGSVIAAGDERPGTRILLCLKPPGSPEAEADSLTDADLALVRFAPGRGVSGSTEITALGVSRLTWDGLALGSNHEPPPHSPTSSRAPQLLLTAKTPVSVFEASWAGDLLTVHITGGSGVHIWPGKAHRLLLNNAPPIPIPAGGEMLSIAP